jgi:hypothetical protein
MMETQRPSKKTMAQHRGAHAIGWGVAVFIALQLAFHYPLSDFYPALKDGEYGSKLMQLRAQLDHQPQDKPLIVGLGSSLTQMGLRPDALTHSAPTAGEGPLVFNLGISSGLATSQLICLRRLLAEKIRPDWVLVEIFPRFFFLGSTYCEETMNAGRLQHRDLSLVDRYYRDPNHVRREWCEQQCAPWYFRRNLLQNLFLPTWVPKDKRIDGVWRNQDPWGWIHAPEVVAKLKRTYYAPDFAASLRQKNEVSNQSEFTEKHDAALRELIRLCQTESIGVVLIRMPESSHYRDGYSDARRERINRWLPSLVQSTGVSLVDASQWLADAEFADGFHVDPQGATRFTRRLEAEVLRDLQAAAQRSSSGSNSSVARTPNRNRRM